MTKVFNHLYRFWLGPIEAIRLRTFEVAFTLAFAAYFFIARFRYWDEWLTPEGYHYGPSSVPSYHIEPFALLQPWAALLLGLFAASCCVLVLIGKLRRFSLFGLFLVSVYIQNADALSAFALNIHFIVGFLVLSLGPMRIDQTFEKPDDRRFPQISSAWTLRTLQATILIQFLTAGWCKIVRRDWLNHSDVLWSHIQGPYRNHLAAWMLNVLPMPVWTVMQWGAFLFEVGAPFLLLIPRTRWIAIIWGVGFVSFIAATMNDLVYFAFQLSTYFILFLSAKEIRTFRQIPKLLFYGGKN